MFLVLIGYWCCCLLVPTAIEPSIGVLGYQASFLNGYCLPEGAGEIQGDGHGENRGEKAKKKKKK